MRNRVLLTIFALAAFVLGGGAIFTSAAQAACAVVEEGQQIRMGQRDCIQLKGTDYRLTVQHFYNNPCPPQAACLWSGVGIAFEHRYYSQSMQGVDLIEAFGFDVTVHDTDHETYAVISVTRVEPGS